MAVIFALAILSSSQLHAQDTLISDYWLSPDIPKVKTAQRFAARETQQTLAVASTANPDIPQALLCQDLKVIFVLDESGSIAGSEITSVRTGALALANALLNSGASLRLIEFNTHSSAVNLGGTAVNSTFISNLTSYLNSSFNSQSYSPASSGSCVGWTNWEDALEDVEAGGPADLVIFFTDGNPTAYNISGGSCSGVTANSSGLTPGIALDSAVIEANRIKQQGKHIFVVGVGTGSEINLDNIKAISGLDAFGPGHDILTADYTTPPFEQLAANLTGAVNAICGTELLVDKTASNSGVCSGQSVTFTNSVTNTGGDFNFTALSVVAKDVYPSGYSNLQFVPSAPAGASIAGNTVTYNMGDMLAGQTVTYQIKATVLAPVPVKNYKSIIAATAFNANEVKDSVTVLSGYATSEIDTSSCAPITVNGITYSSTNTYTQTLTSAAGCDSILTLKVTIKQPTENTQTIIVCDSYTWPANGATYTESGTYTALSVNAAGCTHTETLKLTINKSTSHTTSIIACGSYTWDANGTNYTESGTYTATSTNAANCTHTETLELTINKSTSHTTTIVACDSYTWAANGTNYTESGTYTATSTNAANCTHTETLELTINKSTSHTTTIVACDSYTWAANGTNYTESGTYTATSTNAANCTHTETLELTINKSTSHTTTIVACDSYTWAANGTNYTESGTYTATSTNAANCTHTETLELTINKSTSHTTTIVACDSYTWAANGTNYTESGTYTATSTNAANCTHTETLELTINKSTSHTTSIVACGSYTWAANGTNYIESGTYTSTSTNAANCTHTETLELTINKSTSHSTSITACGSYTWAVNGTTYTAGGTYSVTSTNAAGCAHTETLILTINKSTANSTTITACNSYKWAVNGTTYTQGGTYTSTSTNAAGCTHTETLKLTINKTPAIGAISGPSGVCRNQTGIQYSVAPVSNATSYTWILPSGITGTSTSNSITVSIGASFVSGVIQVRANNSCGSCAYTQITVTAPTCVPVISCAITGTKNYCAAGNYTYSIAAVAGAASYTWAVTGTGLSIISGQGTTSITVTATAAFVSGTISVKATNCMGSCSPLTINITTSKIPAKPGTISGPVTGLCKKTNIVYSVPAVPGATSYTWTVPAGATIVSGAGTNTINVSFTSLAGACTVSVKANNACGGSAASSLGVSALTAAPGAITGSASVNKTQTAVIYSVAAVPGASSYTWTITGGAKFVGVTTGNSVTVNFSTAVSTSAVITVKANNACGFSAAATKTIAVSLGLSARSGPANDNNGTVAAVSQKLPAYMVYPNPANGQFNISFSNKKAGKVAIIIVDSRGVIVYKSADTYAEGAHLNKINLSKFSKGAYFVRIQCKDEEEKVIKVLIQ